MIYGICSVSVRRCDTCRLVVTGATAASSHHALTGVIEQRVSFLFTAAYARKHSKMAPPRATLHSDSECQRARRGDRHKRCGRVFQAERLRLNIQETQGKT